MNGVRWAIGLVTTVAALGTVALAVLGGGFRRSFGASDNSAPIIAGVLIFAALAVASVVWPDRRTLLHVVAVLMLALAIACVFIARQTIFVAMAGLLYAGAWLVFYYRSVWQR